MESTEDRLLLASQVKIMFVYFAIFVDLVDAVGKGYAFTCKSGENHVFFPLLLISSMLLAKDMLLLASQVVTALQSWVLFLLFRC